MQRSLGLGLRRLLVPLGLVALVTACSSTNRDGPVDIDELLNDAHAQYAIGTRALRSGNIPRALSSLERARRLDPNNADTLHALALAFVGDNKPERAVNLLTQAIELRPDEAALYNSRAMALIRQRRYAEAESDLRHALEPALGYATPGYAWFNLGETLVALKRFDEALEAYDQAIELSPSNASMRTALCTTLSRLRRYDEAAAQCAEAVTAGGDRFPPAYYELAMVELSRGRNDAARSALERYLELSPQGTEADAARRYLEHLGERP